MRLNLKGKYLIGFFCIFIPIFLMLIMFVLSTVKKRIIYDTWLTMATLAENAALISEDPIILNDDLALQQVIANFRQNEDILESYIINSDKEFVAHSDNQALVDARKYTDLIKDNELQYKREKSRIYEVFYNQESVFIVNAPIYKKNTDVVLGNVEIIFSKKNIIHVVNNVLKYILIFVVASLMAISLFVWLMVAWLNKPIEYLTRGVEEISKGNYDVFIEQLTRDEIGELTQGFNHMAKNLKDKELIKEMFSKYLSPDIAEFLLKNRENIALGGETRYLTVMFTDIRGFTSMSEEFSPEDIVKFLNNYFTEMVGFIFLNKGTLDKFLGDGILAIYGAPVDLPEHPLCAVRTAVQMMNYMNLYNKKRAEWGLKPLYIGAGINTGAAVIGNIGSKQRSEYTVVGDTVNTASRIQGLTGENEIFVSESTYRDVMEFVDIEYKGEYKVKNKKEPIKIYKVLGMKDD